VDQTKPEPAPPTAWGSPTAALWGHLARAAFLEEAAIAILNECKANKGKPKPTSLKRLARAISRYQERMT